MKKNRIRELEKRKQLHWTDTIDLDRQFFNLETKYRNKLSQATSTEDFNKIKKELNDEADTLLNDMVTKRKNIRLQEEQERDRQRREREEQQENERREHQRRQRTKNKNDRDGFFGFFFNAFDDQTNNNNWHQNNRDQNNNYGYQSPVEIERQKKLDDAAPALGLDPKALKEMSIDDATAAVKSAFKKLALKWHPDRNKTPQAEAEMKKINHAYGLLKDVYSF